MSKCTKIFREAMAQRFYFPGLKPVFQPVNRITLGGTVGC
jgi:hypothetical protein